ncbi:MAG: hypothetical protein D4R73_08435 [Deltaproteobacteria bacterium]|nr:MAG: hypothetical protein D4R73_08435 [Deltaproteobacteria bacterium]
MKKLVDFLNSPFGLLIAGAIISGLLVQYIASKWQQKNWLFQQRFTAESAKFDKELEQKYKILEEINGSVAEILTHSQDVVVGHLKQVPTRQRDEEIRSYNEAVMKWETNFRIYTIRLKTFFTNKELPVMWDAIKKERDSLDVALYLLTAQRQGTPDECLGMINKISDMAVNLSQRMLAEINQMKQRGFKL